MTSTIMMIIFFKTSKIVIKKMQQRDHT